MKKLKKLFVCSLLLSLSFCFFACGSAQKTILVPNDGSNCTRALFLLEENGYIRLKDGVKPTDNLSDLDIADSRGYNVKLVEAGLIPAQLKTGGENTLAVINGNYALSAGISVLKAIALENAQGEAAKLYANVLAVKAENETNAKTLALKAALESESCYNFIKSEFGGAVLPSFTPDNADIPAPETQNDEITVAASSTPHARILEHVKPLLEQKGWKLTISVFDDYVLPNVAVFNGSLNANFFQHVPFMNTYNAEKKADLVAVTAVHYEPFGLYDFSATK